MKLLHLHLPCKSSHEKPARQNQKYIGKLSKQNLLLLGSLADANLKYILIREPKPNNHVCPFSNLTLNVGVNILPYVLVTFDQFIFLMRDNFLEIQSSNRC